MNDLTLNCPKCGGQFISSIELAGQEIACPHCSESILLPKTKPKMAWIFAGVFIFVVVCVASIVVWKHTAKHDITPQVPVAENTNSQAVVLQTGPLAIEQLLSVAKSGDVKTVKLLLDAGVDVNARGTDGATALMNAAWGGSLEIVKLLIEKGADVNEKSSKDRPGFTALMCAASTGSLEITKLLLEKGADINAIDQMLLPGTALNCAAGSGETDEVRLLLDNNADIGNALVDAARSGSVETIKLLLDRGADVNEVYKEGAIRETALMDAASAGKYEAVKFLLERGADVNAKDKNAGTALLSAVYSGQTNVVGLLLDNGADINANGGEPLKLAVFANRIQVVKLLLARGADVNAMSPLSSQFIDETALKIARERTNTVIVELLQQAGATDSPASAVPTAAAVAPDKAEFEVISLTARATEKNDAWWRYGYRLTIRNNGTDDNRQFFDIQFLDADGYVIDTKPVYDIIKPGTTDIITGDKMINLPGAVRVANIKAVWTYGK